MTSIHKASDAIDELLRLGFDDGFKVAKRYMSSIGAENFWIGNNGGAINDDVPTGWHEHYLEQQYEQIDPVLKAAYRIPSVHRWDSVINREILTKQQINFLEESAEAGFRDGISIPISGPKGRLIFNVSVSGRTRDFDSERPFRCIHGVVQVLMLSLPEMTEAPQLQVKILTRRERMAVEWAAVGKTYFEIGELMNISESTVKKHMQSAMVKLGVPNVVSLVSTALRLEEIQFDGFMG